MPEPHAEPIVGAPSQAPVQLTQDQIKTATDYLTANWKFITIK